ncbi:MAG: endopeptidase La [Ruminococcaceae bacterium]|jgi:ATP-dependent Lon protease|nr:endopeptidase La [Oscillospiraceae bacterium]
MELTTLNIPVVALRGMTVFPEMTTSFDVEREISIYALERAMDSDHRIFLVTQREIGTQLPEESDLFTVGTVCRILHLIKTSDSSVRLVVEGEHRARLHRLWQVRPFLQANVELLEEDFPGKHTDRVEALLRQTYSIFSAYRELVPNLSDELVSAILDGREPGRLADYIAQNITLRHTDRQRVLEELHPVRRLALVNEILAREVDVISMELRLEQRVRERVSRVQKDAILREQVKVLRQELGEDDDEELNEYAEKIERAKLTEEVRKKLLKELDRLGKQPYGSAEGAVIRNYLDVCLDIPWNRRTRDRADVERARKILDRDHYGLDKVKERILEFIAVRQINPDAKGRILCLVGPPGVGKTSVAISVAKAMNRKLARLSLGGVRDEADIRGHRKTYIGAMPGRIIEALTRAGSMNPLLVLDEIDKLGSDMRGDPAAALLEVLDSEQNNSFRDHFVELPVDLSQVMFITTANTLSTIPRPLLDRMEVIELSSYTDEEKVEIARRHLLPKQLKEHGLKRSQLRLTDGALRRTIAAYTRESGVRVLERQLGNLCRKTAMKLVSTDVKHVDITEKDLKDYLGTPPYQESLHMEKDEVGVVNGLAWTAVGGEILEVEANVVPGSGKLELTGNLGLVMQESAKAALSCLRSRAAALGLEPDFYQTKDIHIHFPEGAVPKDGPSAGVTITTAVLSALTGRRVRRSVAMTGEVTLRGRVLPIGGLKEKTMAAMRNGITTVILPRENEKDLEEIDQTVRKALHFVPVDTVDAVFTAALVPEDCQAAVERLAVLSAAELPRQEVQHVDQL